jgi:hypothetical protein
VPPDGTHVLPAGTNPLPAPSPTPFPVTTTITTTK